MFKIGDKVYCRNNGLEGTVVLSECYILVCFPGWTNGHDGISEDHTNTEHWWCLDYELELLEEEEQEEDLYV